jgi:hypothetical protein
MLAAWKAWLSYDWAWRTSYLRSKSWRHERSLEQHRTTALEVSGYLNGTRWRWATWRERPATSYDPSTGVEEPAVWDHDHCHFCYHTDFSERYENDLREGWLTTDTSGLPPEDHIPGYQFWVCPECFERHRDHYRWTIES